MPAYTHIETDADKIDALVKRRMLEVPDILLAKGIISYKKELLELLNLERQHWNNIKNGDRNFSKAHIYTVCKKYRINANWLMGFEKNMFRQ